MAKRCQEINCRHKLKLTDMVCKCEKKFCCIHRLPESHNCTYNFKLDKIKLEGIKAEKIIKI
jgi:predicted nucleic acid binding AN1-type Zn finger protein